MTEIDRLVVKTLADQAQERIEAAIMRGELAPGTKLSDLALARRLGISRGPVREAIRRLEGRKLVAQTPHVGATVVALSWEDLIEIFTVREALEGIACRLAAANMTAEELVELDGVLESHHKSDELRSGVAYYQQAGDLDFHYRIARGSRNKRLMSLLGDDLYHLLRLYRYQAGATPGRARRAFAEHREILAAMRARNADLSESLMRAHIARARHILEEKSKSGKAPGFAAAASVAQDGKRRVAKGARR